MRDNLQTFLISQPVVCLLFMFILLISVSSSLIFLFENFAFNWFYIPEWDGQGISVIDSIFTGFSASTITGLTVVDTSILSLASQITILMTIQIGALLAMAGGVFIILLALHMGMPHQGNISAASLFLGERWKDAKFIVAFVLLVETIAFLLLFFHFRDSMGDANGAWYAVFHAVSGFCSAGFFLFPDNFYSLRNDPFVLFVIMGEIILGGLGFLVIVSMKIRLVSLIRREKIYGWPVQVKLTFVMTAALILLGFVAFWGLELENILRDMSIKEQALVSIFQSVTARPAGFSTVDMGNALPATQLSFMGLMFVGAGSMSVSGGIKVTTLAIFLLALWAMRRRREDVIIWKRVIPQRTITRAFGVFVISLIVVFSFIFMLLILEKSTFKINEISFEAMSAFGTVGLSTGITSSLSVPGKVLISLLMLMGRLGPLALTYILGKRIIIDKRSFLEEEVEVG